MFKKCKSIKTNKQRKNRRMGKEPGTRRGGEGRRWGLCYLRLQCCIIKITNGECHCCSDLRRRGKCFMCQIPSPLNRLFLARSDCDKAPSPPCPYTGWELPPVWSSCTDLSLAQITSVVGVLECTAGRYANCWPIVLLEWWSTHHMCFSQWVSLRVCG